MTTIQFITFNVIIFLFTSIYIAQAAPLRRVRTPSEHARHIMRDTNNSVTTRATSSTILIAPSTANVSFTPTLTSTITSSPSATEITSNSLPSAPPADTDGSPKYIVAHHIVGNTFPYTPDDWADDMALAQASGIDGFALNVGVDSWQPDRVKDAYDAAKASGHDFKLFLSLDMSSLPCSSPDNAQAVRNLVAAHISHPNQLQYNGRAFVSTFAGESCTFGQDSVPDGWKSQFVQHPQMQGKIYFVPAFFINPTQFTEFADVMDGDFNWNGGWPTNVTTSFANTLLASLPSLPVPSNGTLGSLINASPVQGVSSNLNRLQVALSKFIGSTDSDQEHLNGLAALSSIIAARDGESTKRAYMGAVSPWFFTHYGANSFNKNFIFLSDQHLYSQRWESVIDARDQFDIIEVVTWNDYGESHYVGPIKGDQPNSQAWTDGMNHTAWLDLTQYYSTAFKTGKYPTIEKDKIVMWSRPHAGGATSADPVGQPDNFELSEDALWAVVMATKPSTVTLTTSESNSKAFSVPAGVTKLSISIAPGDTMKGTITRNDQTIVELDPDFTFQGTPKTYNFNAFVVSATAD